MQMDKSVPIPQTNRYGFDKMEVGDSRLFEELEDAVRMANAAYAYAVYHQNGFRVTRRKVKGGYRVWRTE